MISAVLLTTLLIFASSAWGQTSIIGGNLTVTGDLDITGAYRLNGAPLVIPGGGSSPILQPGSSITSPNPTNAWPTGLNPFTFPQIPLLYLNASSDTDGKMGTLVNIKRRTGPFTGTVTAGSSVVTGIASTAGLLLNGALMSGSTRSVNGPGTPTAFTRTAVLPGGTTLASIDSSSQITLSQPATASGTITIFPIVNISGHYVDSYINDPTGCYGECSGFHALETGGGYPITGYKFAELRPAGYPFVNSGAALEIRSNFGNAVAVIGLGPNPLDGGPTGMSVLWLQQQADGFNDTLVINSPDRGNGRVNAQGRLLYVTDPTYSQPYLAVNAVDGSVNMGRAVTMGDVVNFAAYAGSGVERACLSPTGRLQRGGC